MQSKHGTVRDPIGMRSKFRGQQGQSMLEVALFLSALMVLISGTIQVGVAVYAYLTVINAAREGARSDVGTIPDALNCTDQATAVTLGGSISNVTQTAAKTSLALTASNSTILVTRVRASNLYGTTSINCYYTYAEPSLGGSSTRFTLSELQTRLNQPAQVATGFTEFVVVEFFYSFRFFLAPVDIPMYAYTIMPVLGR